MQVTKGMNGKVRQEIRCEVKLVTETDFLESWRERCRRETCLAGVLAPETAKKSQAAIPPFSSNDTIIMTDEDATAEAAKGTKSFEAKEDAVNADAESSSEVKGAESNEAKNNEATTTHTESGDDQATAAATEDKEMKDTPENVSITEKEEPKTCIDSTEQPNDSKNTEITETSDVQATQAKVNKNQKVKVHFVAVGSAPIMKKTKFQIGADQRFAAVTTFLRKMLKLSGSGSSLFLYCNSAFVPAPDELVGDLNDCFSMRGELVIHYSLQEAWG